MKSQCNFAPKERRYLFQCHSFGLWQEKEIHEAGECGADDKYDIEQISNIVINLKPSLLTNYAHYLTEERADRCPLSTKFRWENLGQVDPHRSEHEDGVHE
jgi:hypothetical protein